MLKFIELSKFLGMCAFIAAGFFGRSLSVYAGESERMYIVIVNDGDTLWGIANRLLQNPTRWPEIVKYNSAFIKDNFIVLPGTKLEIPAEIVEEYIRSAKVIDVVNRVRYKSQNDTTWLRAYKDMAIFNSDNLVTDENSEVKVQFKNKDFLILQKDSTVILKVESGKEEVNLLKGAALMRASTAKLVTPTASVTPKRERTLYRARVNQDQATLVQVESGQTEVTSLGTGDSVIVSEGFANITRRDEDPGQPIIVPDMAEFKLSKQIDLKKPLEDQVPAKAPEKKELKLKPALPDDSKLKLDKVEFAKLDSIHSDSKWRTYRLQIASDENFLHIEREYLRNVVAGRTVVDIKEDYQLPDGSYYRRVAYSGDTGGESTFYPLPDLLLATRNPKLSVESPEEGLTTKGQFVKVSGKSETGMILTVNDLAVEVRPDGSFYWAVLLSKKGENKIRVVAKDLEGNKTYLERTVCYAGR